MELVRHDTGVPVTIGIAETKTLAKLANHLAKNSKKAGGVLDLTGSPYKDVALRRTPVEQSGASAQLTQGCSRGRASSQRCNSGTWMSAGPVRQ
jgi:hypothetical protein